MIEMSEHCVQSRTVDADLHERQPLSLLSFPSTEDSDAARVFRLRSAKLERQIAAEDTVEFSVCEPLRHGETTVMLYRESFSVRPILEATP